MKLTKIYLILPFSCLLLANTCYAENKALRAATVAAARRVYKIEIDAIKSAFRLKRVVPRRYKPDEFKFPQQSLEKNNQKALNKVSSLNDLPLAKSNKNRISTGEMIRSQRELNAAGWQKF